FFLLLPTPTSPPFPYTTLFRSFLSIPRLIQSSAASFLEELGVGSTPSTDQIVSHLLHSSESGSLVNQEIYAVLNQRARLRRMKRSEEHTSELQSPCNLVCRLLL